VKMYILIKDNVPPGFAVLAAAHASLACYLKFKDRSEMAEWSGKVFYKVICMVNAKEFDNAKEVENNVVMTETALGGNEAAIAFCPRAEYPKAFKFYRLWK
jgi:peptidyl-tRNA hydrolase